MPRMPRNSLYRALSQVPIRSMMLPVLLQIGALPFYSRHTVSQSYLDRKTTTLLKPHRGLTLKLHDLSRGAIAKAFPTKMPSSCKELRKLFTGPDIQPAYQSF
jgi:hypothetical protein